MSNLSSVFPLAALFVSPWFFGAGAVLAGIPILIHILNRRRYKVVRWAAMEYLLQAMRRNRRRIEFEQWILLACRCAVLLLLGMALARPLACDKSRLNLAGRQSGLHVFVIDNSYSMAYLADRPDAKTHLDQAKLLAKQYVDKLAGGSEAVVVVTAATPATAIIARPSFNLAECRDAIDRVEQGYTGTDYAGALQLATRIAREADRVPGKFLYLFTDDTASAWQGPQAGAVKEIGHQLADVFKKNITVHNLGLPGQWNQAVLDVKPATNLLTTRWAPDFMADVRGFGAGPDPVFQWKLDGADLPAGGTGTLKLDETSKPVVYAGRKPISEGGPHYVTARLVGSDRLSIDDARYRSIDVASELKVLIIEGERGLGALSGSGSFLELALAPPSDTGTKKGLASKSRSPITPEVISAWELNNKILANYRAIILANVGGLSGGQADKLQQYVNAGGALMLFMGPQVNGDNYNSLLLGKDSDGKPRTLLPGKLIKTISVDQNAEKKAFTFAFDPSPDVTPHPFLEPFKGHPSTGLDTAQVFTYWQVEPDPDLHVEHVLDYAAPDKAAAARNAPKGSKPAAGDPAVTVHSSGRGRVVWFSTTANADWTSFPAKPAFVALMNEAVYGAVTSGDAWMNLNCGEALVVPPTQPLNGAPQLHDPTRKEALPLEAVGLPGGATAYKSNALLKPGVYWLNVGTAKEIPLSVNVPAEEADVRTLAPAAVRTALGDIDLYSEGDHIPADLSTRDRRNDLSWWVMTAVLALAGAECFMAMHFGHYKKK